MIKLRKGSIPLFIVCVISIFTSVFSAPVKADTITTTGANDFYFELQQGTTFTVRATAWQYGIDSMLWLYNSNNQVLIANDDYFGLDSYISYNVQQTGIYRLRTGVCCGDPNRWYREFYTIETNSVPTNIPTTTSTSTSTTTTSTTTTTTTIAPYLNPPRNLVVSSVTTSRIYLNWDAPNPSNVDVERYAIMWSCDNWRNGYGIASTQTSAYIPNLDSGQSCEIRVRADNDTLGVYSDYSEQITGTTETTTTTSTSTTTTTTTVPTTTTQLTTTTTISPVTTIFPFINNTTTTVEETTTTTSTTVPPTTTTTTTLPPEPQGIDEKTATLLDDVKNLTKDEITDAVKDIISEGVSKEEAVALSTKPEILEAISTDEAKEIFQEIAVEDLTIEEESALVEALTNAPEDIKNTFETAIDIFGQGLDDYVPVGSKIDVKSRRTLLAAVGAISTVTVIGGSANGSTPSGGNSNSPSGSGKDSAFKKDEDEDEDDEEAPEIEGPEGGDDEIFTRNSIFKYGEDGMKKFSIWNFIKKFSSETAALAFTISSTIIVFATLSGDTRRITLIATSCAFLVHYVSVMIKNDE